MSKVRVVLPFHLRNLAGITGDLEIEIAGAVTTRAILEAIEERYPVLRGAIREHGTLQRRAFLRFFACEQDLSHDSPDAPLPEAVASGKEPFIILGAIAGGSTSK
jgi:sulfur-carrier protein